MRQKVTETQRMRDRQTDKQYNERQSDNIMTDRQTKRIRETAIETDRQRFGVHLVISVLLVIMFTLFNSDQRAM